jgi:hypothetical protein
VRLRCRYGELEQVSFRESLAAVGLPELGEDLGNALPSLKAFAGATENALGAALERCQQVTGTLQPQYIAQMGRSVSSVWEFWWSNIIVQCLL